MTMASRPQSGPASDPELLILSSLAGGSKHGYGIMQDIHRFAGVKIGPGTLYTAITRLVEKGWIEAAAPEGRQRPYRLTAGGARQLSEQLRSMQELAEVALERRGTI